MRVFRMRAYAKNPAYLNENCAPHKLEEVSELMAQRDAQYGLWIYFFAEITAPESL